MPLPHDPNNYLYGKGRLYFKATGETAYMDLGNVPNFETNYELTKTEHYSSRSGTKLKDLSFISEKKVLGTFNLEESAAELLDLALLGDGVVAGSQSASYLNAVATTLVDDKFVDLGKIDLSYVKVSHGTVATGPFTVGETVEGATSEATAKIGWVATGHLELVNVAGTFSVGETIEGASSGATATVTAVETITDVIVTDAAAATTRYAAGTDYSVDCFGGLIRELSATSTITAHGVYVSANYPAKTTKAVRVLASTAKTGELLFVGEPDQGPKLRYQAWTVSMTVSGAVGLISEDISQIPMEAEILADTTNHAAEPYARVTEII